MKPHMPHKLYRFNGPAHADFMGAYRYLWRIEVFKNQP